MADRSTHSLWTQEGVAIADPMTGIQVAKIPLHAHDLGRLVAAISADAGFGTTAGRRAGWAVRGVTKGPDLVALDF